MTTQLKTISNQRKKRTIKNESHLKFSLIVYLLFTCGNILAQGNLPNSVANQYAKNRDRSISDDFSTIDFNKWSYRRDMGNGVGEGTKYAYIINNSYLSLKGDNATKKGGGLSALKSSHFGFYQFKYRVIGLKPGVDSPWHPSIWGDKNNSGKIWKALTPQPKDKIEIDMIEFYNKPSRWNSHAIAKTDGLRSKSGKLVVGSSDFDNNWHIMGFEYHPNYLQLWENKNGKWEKVGRKVTFTDGETTNTTVNKKNRKPIFNILSNKYHVAEADANKDSWLHIDYFYYFPYSPGNGPGGGNSIVTLRKGNATNYALDGGNGGSNNQNVKLWSFNKNNVNQQWEEINRGNGYYSYKKRNTNFCIDGGNGGKNGSNVKLWRCDNNNQNQHFKKISIGGNKYRLEKRNASGFSIDGRSGGANNQNVHLWASSNNTGNQQWIISSNNAKANKELKNSTSLGLYAFPNPTSGIVKINTDDNLNMLPTQVSVYSFVGSLVGSYENTDTIDLSGLAEGNYFLVINLEDITTKTKKKQIIKVLKK